MGLMSGSYLARVDMTLLIPELIHACVDLFEQLNNRVGITYRAYVGYRPAYPDQQRLYEESLNGGPRAAPPWLSSHQWGLAVDVEAYNPGPTWDDKAYVPLWRALDNHPILRSGHSFGDGDHIELRHPDGPWNALRLAVLPRVSSSDLVSRAWPLIRTITKLAAPGTPAAHVVTNS